MFYATLIAVSGTLSSTITLPEALWTMFGLLGLGISWRNYRQATLDTLAVLLHKGSEILVVTARGNQREEFLRVAKCFVITGIGSAAMATPPANPAQPVSILQIIITVALFLIAVLIVYGSVAAARARATTLRLLRETSR